jgi:hypothetical protein
VARSSALDRHDGARELIAGVIIEGGTPADAAEAFEEKFGEAVPLRTAQYWCANDRELGDLIAAGGENRDRLSAYEVDTFMFNLQLASPGFNALSTCDRDLYERLRRRATGDGPASPPKEEESEGADPWSWMDADLEEPEATEDDPLAEAIQEMISLALDRPDPEEFEACWARLHVSGPEEFEAESVAWTLRHNRARVALVGAGPSDDLEPADAPDADDEV